MKIALEDSWVDVLSKACNGREMTADKLAGFVGVDVGAIQSLLAGRLEVELLAKVARPLGLHAVSLCDLAEGKSTPAEIPFPDGLAGFNTPFEDMTVNNYLAWDPSTQEAAVFDTGTDIDPLMDVVASRELRVTQIFLTHSHGDHVIEIDRLVEKTGATAWIGEREPLEGVSTFPAGRAFTIGGLTIETRLTWGHSAGGITYVIRGLGSSPVAIVGDSIFARSVGGGRVSYEDAMGTIRSEILTLPDQTILCPGHGPLTTVGEEATRNPFFAV
ncbi:MAG: hypothetical protein Fur0032_13660 [Terrimicrobiaceae bacterium]